VIPLGLAALVAVAALAVAMARGPEAPRTLDQRVHDIAADLRCPVCQNLSVADSPSRLAAQIRADISRRLGGGQDPEQVRAFYVARYGRWIDLSPEARGLGLVAWLAPAAALAVGVVVAVVVLRRRRTEPVGGTVSAEDRARVSRELAAMKEPE
jgi:cytochrome c-type biogenesis protein CcmH